MPKKQEVKKPINKILKGIGESSTRGFFKVSNNSKKTPPKIVGTANKKKKWKASSFFHPKH